MTFPIPQFLGGVHTGQDGEHHPTIYSFISLSDGLPQKSLILSQKFDDISDAYIYAQEIAYVENRKHREEHGDK
jgi:hypothetical protein